MSIYICDWSCEKDAILKGKIDFALSGYSTFISAFIV